MYVALAFLCHFTEPVAVHLERLGSLPEDTVRFYVAEIASALAFLHEHRIMHRYVSSDIGYIYPFIITSPVISNRITFSSMNGVTHISQISILLYTLTSAACLPVLQVVWLTWLLRFSPNAATLT
jgi:serine/threonine protein kinase